MDVYRIFTKYFIKIKIKCHIYIYNVYQFPEDGHLSIIIRNLPKYIPEEYIFNAFTDLKINVVSVHDSKTNINSLYQ